jgi:hypothetical protein
MNKPWSIIGGKIIARKLEVGVTNRCCLSCRGCNHLSPACASGEIDVGLFEKSLMKLSPHFHSAEFGILGGEPLLEPRLSDIVKIARESGIADKIILWSNGVLADAVNPAIFNMVDKLIVTVHSPDLDLEKIRGIAHGRCDLEIQAYNSFREPYSEIGTGDIALIKDIYDTCRHAHAWGCFTIERGVFYKCSTGCWLRSIFDLPPDGVDVISAGDVFGELKAYLESPAPLNACKYCLGTVGQQFVEQQIARGGYRKMQNLPTEELLDCEFLEKTKREGVSPDEFGGILIRSVVFPKRGS